MDFNVDRQKDSHIVLVRILGNERQVLTIPNHYELDKGITKGIYNQCKKYIPEIKLKTFFYTK